MWLLNQNFAHGDLKSDNILVKDDGSLVLVDYEGFFIPSLQYSKAYETGTEDYQHPLRKPEHFGKYIDDVSILIISIALHSLAVKPELWKEFHTGENLLFTHKDLLNPLSSPLFKALKSLNNPIVSTRLALLEYGLSLKPCALPSLASVLVTFPDEELHAMYASLSCPKFPPGTLDTTFQTGSGFDDTVFSLLLLPDGRILVGGLFTEYNGMECNRIACLHV